MEFRYKKKPLYLYSTFTLIGIVGIIRSVLSLYSPLPVSIFWITTSIVITFISGSALKFYFSNVGAVILLDEESFRMVRGEQSISVKWSEVEWVSTDVVDSVDIFNPASLISILGGTDFYISIFDGTEIIKFGSHLKGINSLIKVVKSKVGEKFDTTLIPLEYKV